jgi:hypothetical protein
MYFRNLRYLHAGWNVSEIILILQSLYNPHLSLICQYLIQLRQLEAYPYKLLWYFQLWGQNKSFLCLLLCQP